jgi:small subunit ribosomal protein S6
MLNYELLYIIPNQYTDDEAKKIKEKIDGMLRDHGAAIGTEENLGKKKLAYPIGQTANGYYFLTEFELEDGTKLQTINNLLRLDKEILRAQIVSKKKLTPEEIEKNRKREAHRAKATAERTEKAVTSQPAIRTGEEKKAKMKNLDEKLEEILKVDDLV